MHQIGHQITYNGSNFIFHDSQGFESGGKEEVEIVWEFIEQCSAETQLQDQLHTIWYLQWHWTFAHIDQVIHRYCIPMDSPRPLLSTELEFFNKGTGNGKPCQLSVNVNLGYTGIYHSVYSQIIPAFVTTVC